MSRKDKNGELVGEGDYVLVEENEIRKAVIYVEPTQNYTSSIHYELVGFTDQPFNENQDDAYSAWDFFEDDEVLKLTPKEALAIMYKQEKN
ncbi:hypothetical protein U8V72_26930 [Priestia filamentosa]|uniref:hypothetical protein n=1 Tax=Priestia filamentosa TaxID=1402861 RepID=UPI003978BFCF